MARKIPQSQAELEAHLREQMRFIQLSSKSFDDGFEGEAKRLALTIRLLVHDTSRSHSLLGQLGKKNLPFFDTAYPYDPRNLLSYCGLVTFQLGPGGVKYKPLLDHPDPPTPRPVDFDAWWNSIVYVGNDGSKLSRRELILAMANTDGGGHVDPSLDEVYRRLSRENSMGWEAVESGVARQMEGPELAAVRQIAHEVLMTIAP